jgi:hypothetical protein
MRMVNGARDNPAAVPRRPREPGLADFVQGLDGGLGLGGTMAGTRRAASRMTTTREGENE